MLMRCQRRARTSGMLMSRQRRAGTSGMTMGLRPQHRDFRSGLGTPCRAGTSVVPTGRQCARPGAKASSAPRRADEHSEQSECPLEKDGARPRGSPYLPGRGGPGWSGRSGPCRPPCLPPPAGPGASFAVGPHPQCSPPRGARHTGTHIRGPSVRAV